MKKILVSSLICLFLTLSLQAQEQKDLTEINNSYVSQDFSRTLDLVDTYKARSQQEQNAISYLKGHCYLKLKMYDLAIDVFLGLLEAFPDNYEILNNIGVGYFQKNDYKNALKYFNLSFLANTNFKTAQSNYNIALQQLKKTDGNLLIDPIDDRGLILNASGWFYYYLGNLDKSTHFFREAISNAPKLSENYIALGYILDDAREYAVSLKYLLIAESIDPDNPDLTNNLGVLYFHLGDLDKSEEYFNKAISINGYFAEPKNNEGFLLLKKNDFARAILFFHGAISVNHYNDELLGESLAGLAMCQYSLGDLKTAKESKGKAIERNYKLKNDKYARDFLQWDDELIDKWSRI